MFFTVIQYYLEHKSIIAIALFDHIQAVCGARISATMIEIRVFDIHLLRFVSFAVTLERKDKACKNQM